MGRWALLVLLALAACNNGIDEDAIYESDPDQVGLHTSWSKVGSNPWNTTAAARKAQYTSDMALNSLGNPVVAWGEAEKVVIEAWDGSAHKALAPAIALSEGGNVGQLKLALDAKDQATLAWVREGELNVVSQNGQGWKTLLQEPKVLHLAGLAVGEERVYVAYITTEGQFRLQDYSDKWTVWPDISLQSRVEQRSMARLILDSTGKPVVAVELSNLTDPRLKDLHVWRWNNGWTDLGSVLANDTERLGNSSHIDLAVDSKNRVVVAYDYGFGKQTLVVKRQRGSNWKQVGPAIPMAKQPSLVTLPSTTPILAYVESPTDLTSGKVVVLRLSGGTSWSKISDLPLVQKEHYGPTLRVAKGQTKPFYLAYIDRDSENGGVQVRKRN